MKSMKLKTGVYAEFPEFVVVDDVPDGTEMTLTELFDHANMDVDPECYHVVEITQGDILDFETEYLMNQGDTFVLVPRRLVERVEVELEEAEPEVADEGEKVAVQDETKDPVVPE